ncbi:MAG: response regulator [Kofleriaceae bacterium]
MNDELRARFMGRFVDVAGQRCARSLAAVTSAGAGAPSDVKAELHALAGEAGILGLTELAELAQHGERECAAWANAADVAARARCAIAVRTLSVRVRALATRPPTSRRIVVVDDSPLVVEEVSAGLVAAGWEVTAVTEPAHLAHLVRDWRPQVLLLDVNMPGAPLQELCAQARAAAAAPLTICLLSGASDAELTARAREVGADGWVSKVAGLSVVVARVQAMARAS